MLITTLCVFGFFAITMLFGLIGTAFFGTIGAIAGFLGGVILAFVMLAYYVGR